MIKELPLLKTPDWLRKIGENPNHDWEIPINELLKDSLYYPACGFNGTPIKYLAGNVLSFVYADYMSTINEVRDNLLGTNGDRGLKGYELTYQKEFQLSEIVLPNWQVPEITKIEGAYMNIEKLNERLSEMEEFAIWCVYKRKSEYDEKHGPELISLVYFINEMNIIYDALYNANKIVPKVLVIIQPGAACSWENPKSNNSFFYYIVSQQKLPEYLITGAFGSGYNYACWNDYQREPIALLPERYATVSKLKK
jgi:hypothetical protein